MCLEIECVMREKSSLLLLKIIANIKKPPIVTVVSISQIITN